MRGLAKSGLAVMNTSVHVILEHSNRGKQSLGLDLSQPDGVEILTSWRRPATCSSPTRCRRSARSCTSTSSNLRAANPDIIYVRGTGNGYWGPEADRGSYDQLSFWCRPGVAFVPSPQRTPIPCPRLRARPSVIPSACPRSPAGSWARCSTARSTGEVTVVDVSSLAHRHVVAGRRPSPCRSSSVSLWTGPPAGGGGMTGNPLVATYRGLDGRFIVFACLQAGRDWPDMCRVIGRPELATDERFGEGRGPHRQRRGGHRHPARGVRGEAADRVAGGPRRLHRAVGGGAGHARGDRGRAGGGQRAGAAGGDRRRHRIELVAAPVQYDNAPAMPKRAPEFNEHGDQILGSIGLDMDQIIDLKVRGVVT